MNGSEQQPFYVVEVLQRLGIAYQIYTHDGNEKSGLQRSDTFYGHSMERLVLADLSGITVFIMICHIIDDGSAHTASLRERLKDARVIQFHCGNHAWFNAEDVVFNRNAVVKLLYNTWFTETWVFDMHKFASQYYEHLTHKPCKTMPYVWSPTLFDKYVVERDINPFLSSDTYASDSMTLCCFEPNLNVTKTCLLPLLIMNSFYRRCKNRVRKCFIFCASEIIKHAAFRDYLKYLDIATDRLIEIYPRMAFPDVMHGMRQQSLNPVIIGHQVANSQNYLMLEALHVGCPLVHNCEWMQTAGLYYPEWNVTAAVEKLSKLKELFVDRQDVYAARSKAIIDAVAPSNFSNVSAYKKLLQAK